MFLKKMINLKNSLSAKLTFWYAAIFSLSSLLILMIFYQQVVSITIERTDEELIEEIYEYAEMLNSSGMESLIEDLISEVETENEDEFFFQLFSNDGKVIMSSDLTTWKGLSTDTSQLKRLSDNKTPPMFETIEIPTKDFKVRTVISPIGSSKIMQMGLSLEEKEEYLNIFRNLILMLLIPVSVMAAIVGWFMAKKALRGVEEVTRTAENITKGAYEERVNVENRSNEIDRLADTFNKMVEKLHALIKGMREITDNIAHDLRSPLTRIRGIAEMNLFREGSKEEFKKMAVNTVEECDNLIMMINTMLDITEVEAGVNEKVIERVDLSQLINEACELFIQIAGNKKINIITELPDDTIIHTDRAQLQRIVTNLLENSLKYTPENGEIHVSLKQNKDEILLQVKDNGIGISKSDLPKIFERFYRCDTSRTEPGVGLGLSLVKALVEAFGGSISVNSDLNKGSEFTVTMPA